MDELIEQIKNKYGEILKASKYNNENKEQVEHSYNTMLMYEVSYIIEDIIEMIESEDL